MRRALALISAPPAAWLDTAFPVIIGAGLLVAPMPVWAMLFYLTIPVLTGYRLFTGWKLPWRDSSVASGLALILWSMASLAWGYDPSGMHTSKLLWLGDTICTLVFFIAWLMVANTAQALAKLETALLIGGAGNAIFAITRHFLTEPDAPRMWGYGIAGQPVIGGAIMAVLFVLALDRLLRARKFSVPLAIALGLFALDMLLAGSRAPVLGAVIGSALLLIRENWRIWLKLGAVGLVSLCLVILLARRWLNSIISDAISRGTDNHVTIWHDTLAAIAKRPIAGYSPIARLPVALPGLPYPFPHDLYLSLLFYSGAVGLVLFLTLVTSLFLRAGFRHIGRTALCLVPLIVGFTDLSQIVKGPAAIWYIVWVPLLLLLSDLRAPSPRVPCAGPRKPDGSLSFSR